MFTGNDLIDHGPIGEGNFGVVSKTEHEPTKTMMAVKVSVQINSLKILINRFVFLDYREFVQLSMNAHKNKCSTS